MIIKTLSRRSNTGQLIDYIFKYVFRDLEDYPSQGEFGKQKFVIRHNIKARFVKKNFIKEFQENESYRLVHRKDSVKLYHTIISFSNKDKKYITDDLLKDIAKKFIHERGENNLYAGTKHEDKDHIHLHIVISGTQLNGRSSRISKQKLHSIKLVLDKYQREKYPQLSHSLPNHGKKRQLIKERILETAKVERQTDKKDLLIWLGTIYSVSRSRDQFLTQLKAAGHVPYFRNGKLQGIKFHGHRKFRFSRLGYDISKISVLNGKETESDNITCELMNISNVRNRKNRQVESSRSTWSILNPTKRENQKEDEELDFAE